MPLKQDGLVAIHAMLVEFSYNALSGSPGRKAELDALCLDIKTYCLEGKWDALGIDYQAVWLGEISRRLARIVPDADTVIYKHKEKGAITQEKLMATMAADKAPIPDLKFSQFTINYHFQSHYTGQPDWLASKDILEAAIELRREPSHSNDLRIRVHRHSGQWMALNNRGFALHCLANVVPARLAFDTHLSTDEADRLGRSFAGIRLKLRDSIPESRRTRGDWDAMIPSRFTAVTLTKNSPDVIYTVKAIGMVPGAAPDHGNEIVMNRAIEAARLAGALKLKAARPAGALTP